MIPKTLELSLIALAILGVTCKPSTAQTPTVIQIDIDNYAYYYADNPDYSKLAGTAQALPPVSTKTFSNFIGLADIVRVNGAPAKGTWSIRATTTNYTPTPQAGQAIADTTRNFFVDWIWEIQQADGTPVGTIMATGMGFGPPPPGSPSGLSPTAASTMAITGGTGAFLGMRGQAGFSQITAAGRAASVTEDPSIRRTLGGGTRSFLLTLIPLVPPTILSNGAGIVLRADCDSCGWHPLFLNWLRSASEHAPRAKCPPIFRKHSPGSAGHRAPVRWPQPAFLSFSKRPERHLWPHSTVIED